MKKIRIEIGQDIMRGKKALKAEFDLPESWDEVPPALYPHLASLYLATEQKMDRYDKAVRSFILLCADQWTVIKELPDDDLFDLLPLIDWVFNKLDLKKNLLPAVKIREQQFIGPADGLANMRFGEWCFADTFLVDYAQAQDVTCLHKMAAVLYRPAGTGPEATPGNALYRGDRREKFNDQLVDERAALMAGLPLPVLQGIYVFFASCRQHITSQYPHVFPSHKKKTGNEAEGDGWLGIYDDLRADPKYGGAEKLEEEFVDMVFFSLQRGNIKMEELKAKYEI